MLNFNIKTKVDTEQIILETDIWNQDENKRIVIEKISLNQPVEMIECQLAQAMTRIIGKKAGQVCHSGAFKICNKLNHY